MSEGTNQGPRPVAQLADGDRTVVIGGGPAGLTAAYLLAKQGRAVTVLEGDDILGGISRTAQYNGYRFDIGGHRFFTKIKPVEDLWHEILGEDFISVPRLSRIHYNGRFFMYPLRAANALAGLGIWNAVMIVMSYLKARLWPSKVEENFEQWVTNRFGQRLYQIFFKTYTEKVWGIPCTEIRAEWAAQRIQGLSLARAILSAASLNTRSTKIKTLINEFQYPRLGPGQMWETCAERIEKMGGEVLMRHRVTTLEQENGRITAVVAETPEGPVRIEGEHFFSTMPVRSLVRALDPAVPETVRDAAEGLRYRDFIVVALMLDQEDLFPDNWIYIHTPGVKVGRVQNFNNWSRRGWVVAIEGRGPHCPRHRGTRGVGAARGRPGRRRRRDPHAQSLPDLRCRLSRSPRLCARLHRPHHQSPPRGAKRHAQVQQSRPLDADRHDEHSEHAGRGARHLGGQHRLRIPRRATARAALRGAGIGGGLTPVRIGVDVSCLANGRGYGRFTRELLPVLMAQAPEDTFICFGDRRALESWESVPENAVVVEIDQDASPTEAAAADGYRSPLDMLRFTWAVHREAPDVFFSPTVYSFFPLPPGQRAVVTVHDTIAERFPEHTLPTRRARWFWKLKVGLALKQCRIVLTVSDYSAGEIAEVLGVSTARIRVASEAPAPVFRPEPSREVIDGVAGRYGLPSGVPWFTYVGGFSPHKQLGHLVEAHARVARDHPDPAPHLLLVGSLSSDVFLTERAGLEEAIRQAGTGDLVHWLGFVPDQDVRALHAGAVAVVLPSACEGFGLPAVEAAACGTAVVATTASPLPDILDGGGCFVDPHDVEALGVAMAMLLTDEVTRKRMGGRARERAAALSWDVGAAATLAALREAAA